MAPPFVDTSFAIAMMHFVKQRINTAPTKTFEAHFKGRRKIQDTCHYKMSK